MCKYYQVLNKVIGKRNVHHLFAYGKHIVYLCIVKQIYSANINNKYRIYNMTLKEIFEQEKLKPTPIQLFIDEVCRVTDKKTPSTVYRWIKGESEPDALAKRILAEHFKTTPDELFSHVKR